MTIKSLTAEIESSRDAFQRLNELRLLKLRRIELKGHVVEYLYGPLTNSQEQTLTCLAQRIDRLYKFRALLSAKNGEGAA